MGCGNSKVIPDSNEGSKDAKSKKTIDAYSTNDAKRNSIHSAKLAFVNGNNVGGTNKSDIDEKKFNKNATNNNNKIVKYRAKFDPRVVVKYDVRALIGKGSFSRVVRVEHKGTKQPYAIKMIEVKAREGRAAADSELRVLRRVRHPYIVQLIEVFEAPDKIYMVMELATGGELFDRIIRHGSFTEKDATKALQMVLEGLRYLHSLGITHRDLKPENLLYYHPGNDSKLLITDFGLASSRKSGGDVTMKTTCGTPEYIAPEVLQRESYTNMVDCWSVGVITYILLSGTMPFDDENKTRLYTMILQGDYNFNGEPWPHVSETAKGFVRSFLTVNPRERMSCSAALEHPWITNFTSLSNRNLQRSISQNLLKRASSRNSNKSAHSSKSAKSNRSLRSQHRKVKAKELDDLLKKYNRQTHHP
ncbi:serine/threonine-protein kinase H1-like [Styela clava]|uniref:serine/threonine-protein kinase H1-like n=1 Tax=Styela clava TaxID=7725 RepID=UPI00193AB64D|nr:serine/threonine-protein kinase H1-like [Styela clava]